MVDSKTAKTGTKSTANSTAKSTGKSAAKSESKSAKSASDSAARSANKSANKGVSKSVREKAGTFTEAERAAMQERAKELKAEKGRGKRDAREAGEQDLLAKVAEMSAPDRALAQRLHAIIMATAPELTPKTWYGMPAYAKGGKIVCFFQGAAKFEARYATLGFNDTANLDDGNMWPTAFALKELTPAEEARITELVRRAVS